MPTKYRGRVDCFISPPSDTVGVSSRAASEVFTNTVQHMLQVGPELGIEMIAANRGIIAGQAGSGWQFWDEGNPVGNRAWAVFRFHSASHGKFDWMIFCGTGSSGVTFGSMLIGGNTFPFGSGDNSQGNVGYAFGVHPSGSNTGSMDGPWNGEHFNLTSASIGQSGSIVSVNNPVWKLNAQNKGAFFPRSNGLLGTHSGSRNNMTNTVDPTSGRQGLPWTFHIIVSEDSVTSILNQASSDLNYKITHFGPYLPRSGVSVESPYAYFSNQAGGVNPFGAFWNTILGSLTGPQSSIDGGVCHPNLISGSQTVGLVVYGGLNVLINTNNCMPDGFSNYEKFPVFVAYANATTSQYGILGQLKHIYQGWGMNSNAVSTISGSAAFGAATPQSDKLIIPWSGSYPGSRLGTRTGRSMNFNVD